MNCDFFLERERNKIYPNCLGSGIWRIKGQFFFFFFEKNILKDMVAFYKLIVECGNYSNHKI